MMSSLLNLKLNAISPMLDPRAVFTLARCVAYTRLVMISLQ